MKIKVCDYIVKYLEQKEITDVFGYPGGMVTYLMEAFSHAKEIRAHVNYNEQASAFAACGYAQASGKTGIAYATSGPGATNLVTGICNAYFDSIPTVFLTGQVNTYEAKTAEGMRQKGFQETNIISLVQNVTKYSEYVDDAKKIKYCLDKAFAYANSGRKGPCLLDIPMNIQRTEIETDDLEEFQMEEKKRNSFGIQQELLESLRTSKRPIILFGNGINIAGVKNEFQQFIHKAGIPAVSSMLAVDVLPYDDPNYFGFIGSYGHRYANYCIYNCDLLLTFGTRLDNRQTGVDTSSFTKAKKIIRFDIDPNEFNNRIQTGEYDYQIDLKDILLCLMEIAEDIPKEQFEAWMDQCTFYKQKLYGIDDMEWNGWIAKLGSIIPDDVVITTDVGQNQVWLAQSFPTKRRQQILFSGGHGAMGYSLPAAIGAYYALGKPVYCFTGDGGLQMNIQELQYIVREKIPVKIIVLNNNALGMIRHFQEMYFAGNYSQTIHGRGYSSPDFIKIGAAYGLHTYCAETVTAIEDLKQILLDDEAVIVEVVFDQATYVFPKLAVNQPICKQEPPLEESLEKLLDESME